ncbi:MAG: hypothetical protein ACAI35_12940 [Candidatus Methylacidiphilales bacterium]|nr:hypothetical protein [Candidatus Methylacidiphilales bacterium]
MSRDAPDQPQSAGVDPAEMKFGGGTTRGSNDTVDRDRSRWNMPGRAVSTARAALGGV